MAKDFSVCSPCAAASSSDMVGVCWISVLNERGVMEMRKLVVALLAFSFLNATAVLAEAKTKLISKSQSKGHAKSAKTHAKAKSYRSPKSNKSGYARSKRKAGTVKQLKRK
jgi:hypothetical protein